MAVWMGVDGCPGGWVCVMEDAGRGTVEARVVGRLAEAIEGCGAGCVVMVDMPIGLPERGKRRCDEEARRRLGWPRAASVFSPPIRPMLAAGTYAEACAVGVRVDGRKISRQAWGLVGKMREVDGLVRAGGGRQAWVREVHPEVSFQAWNGGRAMGHRKKSAAGRAERERLVVGAFGEAYRRAQEGLPRGTYGNDDLLDAFAALWTARRVARGEAEVLPGEVEMDDCGLRMEIVV